MIIYVGINAATDDLVVGDMVIEVTLYQGKQSERLLLLDYETNKLIPVEACIQFRI